MKILTDFMSDASGATSIEYAMIASVIAVATAAGTSIFSNGIVTAFANLGGLFG